LIRQATRAEVEKVTQGYLELLEYEEINGSNSGWKKNIYPTFETALTAWEKGWLYVLDKEGEICASMILNQIQPEEYYQIPWQYQAEDEKVLVVHTLCVPPSKARKGYGQKMMEYAAEHAVEKGYKVVRIDTWAENVRAQALYKKLGYRIAGKAEAMLAGVIAETEYYLEVKI